MNADHKDTWPANGTIRIVYHSKADSHGRYTFEMLWTEPNGVFRPEKSKHDDQPVGYRRGQVFFAAPGDYIQKHRAAGLTVEEIEGESWR